MKNSIKYSLFLILLVGFTFSSKAQIDIEVKGMKSYKGNVLICFYDRDHFLIQEEALTVTKVSAKTNSIEFTMKSLPQDYYAICVYQDENENNILDVNKKGRPKEYVAFSNKAKWNKKTEFPTFDDCVFVYRDKRMSLVFDLELP